MAQPLISVIVPVYKSEQYLDKCIQSIVNQTYENLEIILIDDGSPDNSPKICDDWALKDNRICVVHTDNKGVSSARNLGLDIAKGDYFSFVDSDDWIDIDFFSVLLNAMLKNNASVVSSGFCYEYFDSETEYMTKADKVINDCILSEYLFDNIRPEVCSKLYSRSIIGDLRFDINIKYSEDVLFNYYICKKCSCLVNLSFSNYHYLQESGNSSTTPYITDARAESYKIYVEFVEDCKDTDCYNAAIWRFTRSVISILSRVMMVPDYSEKYYCEIVEAIIKYKNFIINNKHISLRYKTIVIFVCLNRFAFKRLVSLILK